MKDIPGYEGLYAATKNGKIWAYPKTSYSNAGRWKKGRFLKFFLIGHGYKVASLYKNKIQKKFLVHRLVALTYLPNPRNLREINHKNAKKLDNRVENLEWISSKENKQHAIKLGLYKGHEKLTEEIVRKIREEYATGLFKQIEIAEKYNTNQYNISWIVRRKGWKHVI